MGRRHRGHLRSAIEEELEHPHAIGSNRVMEYLWRIQIKYRSPSKTVCSLEKKDCSNSGVDTGVVFRLAVHWALSVRTVPGLNLSSIPFVRAPIMKINPVREMVLVKVVGFRPQRSQENVPSKAHTRHQAFKTMFCAGQL
jgi:hypothetical protein